MADRIFENRLESALSVIAARQDGTLGRTWAEFKAPGQFGTEYERVSKIYRELTKEMERREGQLQNFIGGLAQSKPGRPRDEEGRPMFSGAERKQIADEMIALGLLAAQPGRGAGMIEVIGQALGAKERGNGAGEPQRGAGLRDVVLECGQVLADLKTAYDQRGFATPLGRLVEMQRFGKAGAEFGEALSGVANHFINDLAR